MSNLPPPKNPSITFYIQVYKDYALANACLNKLRMHYPDARILVISDGDPDPRYHEFIKKYKVEYQEGERLYPVQHGGKMLQRMLDFYLQSPTDYFVKMDSDTRVDRPFRTLPQGNHLFGHPANHGCLQGGCIVFPKDVAQKIFDSQLLLSKELVDWKSSWIQIATNEQSKQKIAKRAEQQGLIGFEWILKWACLKLNIQNKAYNEIYSDWKIENPNKDLQYAFVHPDKYLHTPAILRSARQVLQNLKRALKS